MPTTLAIVALVMGGVSLSLVVAASMRTASVSSASPAPLDSLGRRVLIVVPHPDDETLAAGGTIHRLVRAGALVRVVVLTAGDSYRRAAARLAGKQPDAAAYLRLGEVRYAESLLAAAKLGLEPADVVSLGYADHTLSAMWNDCWDPSSPAQGRNGATCIPYSWAARPARVMCGADLAADLESEIREFAPETVIAPDVFETHPDHSAAAQFSIYAMDAVGYRGRRLSAVVHFRHYPYPWAHLPGRALDPPPHLIAAGTSWLALPLDEADQRAKADAIAEYRSQTAIADLGIYMRAFVRTNELFASRPAAAVPSQTGDGRPVEQFVVAVTPRPVIPAPPGSGPRIEAIRMVRGATTVWIGLRCDAALPATATVAVAMRLFDGSGAPARLDVSATGGGVSVAPAASNSIAPEGIRAELDGNTAWIVVPEAALATYSHSILAARVFIGDRCIRTPWNEVAL